MPAFFCHSCLSTSLTLTNGVYICDVCGVQSQHVEEESEAFEMGTHARWAHKGAGVSAATLAEQRQDAEEQAARVAAAKAAGRLMPQLPFDPVPVLGRLKALAALYLRAMQELLQAQADALVKVLGAPPEVRVLLRNMWMGLLPYTGLLDLDPRVGGVVLEASFDRRGVPRLARTTNAHNDTSGTEVNAMGARVYTAREKWVKGRTQPLEDFHYKAQMRFYFGSKHQQLVAENYVRRHLPPRATHVLVYLACLLLRLPVTPVDVGRWALDGVLPFLDLRIRSQSLVTASGLRLTARLLRARGCVPPVRLTAAAVQLSELLGLPMPPLNVEGLLTRWGDQLGLPRQIPLVARELHRLYLQGTPLVHPCGMGARGTWPYLPLMALLFVALRLGYGLDDRGRAPPAAEDVAVCGG
ncbi:hypothetical protein Agub_g39, partial [Astrephomene gubernaculifera]